MKEKKQKLLKPWERLEAGETKHLSTQSQVIL